MEKAGEEKQESQLKKEKSSKWQIRQKQEQQQKISGRERNT